jgi:hypothetical protein
VTVVLNLRVPYDLKGCVALNEIVKEQKGFERKLL